jgi:transposase
VIPVDQWHTIRCLHQRGVSRRQIARELGVSRNTVARALAATATPEYRRIAPVTGEAELAEFLRSCLRRGLKGSRILNEARTHHGYSGSPASFYRLLKQVQAETATPPASQRFETAPGEQAQFDWAEYPVSLGGTQTKLYVYALALGYSRRCHWFPSLAVKQPAVFEALEASWRHYPGACRELVVDNARCFVTKHPRTELVRHPRFLRLDFNLFTRGAAHKRVLFYQIPEFLDHLVQAQAAGIGGGRPGPFGLSLGPRHWGASLRASALR